MGHYVMDRTRRFWYVGRESCRTQPETDLTSGSRFRWRNAWDVALTILCGVVLRLQRVLLWIVIRRCSRAV